MTLETYVQDNETKLPETIPSELLLFDSNQTKIENTFLI